MYIYIVGEVAHITALLFCQNKIITKIKATATAQTAPCAGPRDAPRDPHRRIAASSFSQNDKMMASK